MTVLVRTTSGFFLKTTDVGFYVGFAGAGIEIVKRGFDSIPGMENGNQLHTSHD